MSNKVIIVTGANTGIGFEVTRVLCEKGNHVILACRSEERANRAIEKLKRQVPNALATFMELDLASLESVRKFVDAFHATQKKLNILVNNAGLSLGVRDTKRQYTKENFELVMGTNHLGHFLLTNLLLDDLKKTASEEGGDARIIVVTSSLHDPEYAKKRFGVLQPLDFENFFLFKNGSFNGIQAYKNSKAANVMFAYELCRRLDGTGVKVNAICPGFVPTTELMRNASSTQKFFCRYILHGMLRFTKSTRTVQQAANAIVTLALDDEKFKDVTGKFIRDGQEIKSSEETLDEEKQQKLWELSGGYTHLEGYEAIEVPPPPVAEEKVEKTAETVEVNGGATKTGDEKKTEDKEESKPEGEVKTEKEETKEVEDKKEKVEECREPEVKKEEVDKKEEEKEEKNEEIQEKEKEVEMVVEVTKDEVETKMEEKYDIKHEEESKPEETKDEDKKDEDTMKAESAETKADEKKEGDSSEATAAESKLFAE